MHLSSARLGAISLLGTLIIVVAIGGYASIGNTASAKAETIHEPVRISTNSISSLQNQLADLNYHWPPKSQVIPPAFVEHLPSELSEISNVQHKKALFVQLLTPLVLLENQRLIEQRRLAKALLHERRELTTEEQQWLTDMKNHYRIKTKNPELAKEKLLRRLDKLPTELVLAQAAMESGWGTSRFAQEGNSLFGQWTFDDNKGLVPENRNEDANHSVKAFENLQGSIRSYLHNINTNPAYKELRQLRQKMREQNKELDAHKLAKGLVRYSQRGADYVTEIKSMLNLPSIKKTRKLILQPTLVESRGD